MLAGLPPTSRELLRASFFRAVSGNPDHPLRVRLRENAIDRWRPDAPIRVYHSPDDEEVFFGDALVSVDRRRRRGADVTVRTLPGFDHAQQLGPGHAPGGAYRVMPAAAPSARPGPGG